MVEIRYDKHSEHVNLAGKSVAEVREQYKSKFDLPDKAKAILNDKGVRRQREAEMKLADNDRLYFEVKNKRGFYFATALLVALVASGGLFAFTYTTASITGVLTAGNEDFATISVGTSTNWTDTNATKIIGRTWGIWNTGKTLFTITPTANYTGDLHVKVYLTNAGELSHAYKHLNMKLQCSGSENATGHSFQLLTLENAEVAFDIGTLAVSHNVTLEGGTYHVLSYDPLPWSTASGVAYSVTPELYCEVEPR